MAADTPIAMLIPIGQPLGMDFSRAAETAGTNGRAADMQPNFRVRVGNTIARLTDEQFGAWLLAHGDRGRRTPLMTSRTVHIELQRSGVAEPDRAIASLVDIGLLKEVPTDDVGRLLFARTHRMRPLMMGLGNSPDYPDRFAVGFPNSPLVTMTSKTYRLVTRSAMYGTLIEAVLDLSDVGSAEATREGETGDVLRTLLADIHEFLSVNVVYFDHAAERLSDTVGA
ncbi:hypothetical protein CLV47_108115 [Antricoccus suffuscus]|uniref:Uncharacterized protein n=1 Tax=Antricoccus suffuscus TaxID=1629062 RepID=A0A2T0ZZH3_9ACTN|nr:hypothetical protein [Antricoccus suffuscus]PRZ41756.1 hypothetical protein CLV47_108115 [Antricoccus suffuscus]